MHASGPLCCKWHVLCLVFDACSHACCKCHFNIQLELIFHHVHIYIDIYIHTCLWRKSHEHDIQRCAARHSGLWNDSLVAERYCMKPVWQKTCHRSPTTPINEYSTKTWIYEHLVLSSSNLCHASIARCKWHLFTNQFIRFPILQNQNCHIHAIVRTQRRPLHQGRPRSWHMYNLSSSMLPNQLCCA